jgi:hypothetical protein
MGSKINCFHKKKRFMKPETTLKYRLLVTVQETSGHLQLQAIEYCSRNWRPLSTTDFWLQFKKPEATFNYRLLVVVQEAGGHLQLYSIGH